MAEPPGPRERIVRSAAQHLRKHGVAGTALRAVVADAGAPWGSLQYYFPDGKDQLAAEALRWSGRFAVGRVEGYARTAASPTPQGLLDVVVGWWVDDLERGDFALGCPVAATVADGVTGAPVGTAAGDALAEWEAAIAAALRSMGVTRARATSLATLVLCALEGGIVLSRAARSTAPLRSVRRQLLPLLEGALPDVAR